MDPHHSIATTVRSQFLLGEYELAALAAFRQVEIRVRSVGRFGDDVYGVELMRKAFGPNVSTNTATRSATGCIFCGDSELTNEHIFPRWLADILPEGVVGAVTVERTQQSAQVSDVRTWRARDVASQKVGVVCRSCNNGWMSAVEERVKPILEPMVLGKPTLLPVSSQLELATWTVMKSFVVEFAFAEQVVGAQADREALRVNGHPHGMAQVRLGSVERDGIPSSVRRIVYNVGREGTRLGFANCVTFALGCALLQALYGLGVVTDWATVVRPHEDHLPINPPCGDTNWPPPRSMTATTLGDWENPIHARPALWQQQAAPR